MNPLHGGHPASGEAIRQLLPYRLAVIEAFLLAVTTAGLADRAWHGHVAQRAAEVHSTR